MNQELNAFIEPYASEIYATNVIYNKSLHGYKCAVLTFVDKVSYFVVSVDSYDVWFAVGIGGVL